MVPVTATFHGSFSGGSSSNRRRGCGTVNRGRDAGDCREGSARGRPRQLEIVGRGRERGGYRGLQLFALVVIQMPWHSRRGALLERCQQGVTLQRRGPRETSLPHRQRTMARRRRRRGGARVHSSLSEQIPHQRSRGADRAKTSAAAFQLTGLVSDARRSPCVYSMYPSPMTRREMLAATERRWRGCRRAACRALGRTADAEEHGRRGPGLRQPQPRRRVRHPRALPHASASAPSG